MACDAHTYEISGRGHNDLLMCPMKDSRPWSHMSTRTTDGTYLKTFCQSVQNGAKIKEKKKRMTIAKRFALHKNEIK